MSVNHKIKRCPDIPPLANNERTSAFYKTYEQGIVMDEDNDFGYIPSSEQPEPEEGVVEEDEDEEGADDEEEKENEPAQERAMNPRQLRRELLAAVERGEVSNFTKHSMLRQVFNRCALPTS